MHRILAFALVFLSACTAGGLPSSDRTYVLAYLDDGPFAPRATLRLAADGGIGGDAPCNLYGGTLAGPLPDFRVTTLTATEMACADLAAEAVFFDSLRQMTFAEVTATGLTLRNEAGRIMVFRVQD
jgi:heat shock protein HslJ